MTNHTFTKQINLIERVIDKIRGKETIRIFKCFKSQGRKVVEAAGITNTTEEPLKATPEETNTKVFSKATDLFPGNIK